MTREIAENIGIKVALKSVTIGILIAYLIPTILVIGDGIQAVLWIFKISYWINIVIGILIFYACGYYFGKKAGIEILINKKDYQKVGAKYGFLTLIVTAFLSSWIGFFQEGIDSVGTIDNPFEDYIFKPMFWILLFGFLPAILVGMLFGKWIKKKAE
jgi:hypothetical protein